MPADLHTHTTFSDGGTDIEKLPFLAATAGLTHLAITDHDTFKAWDWCSAHAGDMQGVTLIPAVEISCEDKQRRRRVHMLCYLPNKTPRLQAFFDNMCALRNVACGKSLARVQALYPAVTDDSICEYRTRSGTMFKVHIMRRLMECGYTDTVYGSLYHKLFNTKDGPCLVNPPYIDVYEALDMIKEAGGVAVLAHASVYHSVELARQLCAEGAIDGVEINHPRNTADDKVQLQALAEQYGLIVTGGTDYHGIHSAKPLPVGAFTAADEMVQRIIALAQSRKAALQPNP